MPPARKRKDPSAAQEGEQAPPPSLLILGLGNPGKRYERTRHNVGAMLLESILAVRPAFSSWRRSDGAWVAAGTLGAAAVVVAQPMTPMNLSGRAAAAIARRHALPISRILVVHDDLDLAVGRIKLKCGGSGGGHRGVSSCEYNLGGPEFWRLRVGIGRPANQADVASYVLEDFGPADAATLDGRLRQVVGCLPLLLDETHTISAKSSSSFLNALARPLPPAAANTAKVNATAAPPPAAAAAGDAGGTASGAGPSPAAVVAAELRPESGVHGSRDGGEGEGGDEGGDNGEGGDGGNGGGDGGGDGGGESEAQPPRLTTGISGELGSLRTSGEGHAGRDGAPLPKRTRSGPTD